MVENEIGKKIPVPIQNWDFLAKMCGKFKITAEDDFKMP